MRSRTLWLLFLSVLLMTGNVFADDGVVEDEAEGEGQTEAPATETTDDELPKKIGPSADAQISFFLTDPPTGQDIVAGKLVQFLIGFANRGEKDFIVHYVEPSFRYPMDFSYSMLNLTAARFERTVAPKQEATFDYRFIPSDAFIGRPVGFVVNLHYTDAAGGYYVNTVFNQTITVQEDDSTFNTETGFLFVLLIGLVILLLFIGHHYLSKFTRKTPAAYQSARHETGTSKDEVDYEWIPRSHLTNNKSPKPGASPRNRRAAKAN
ncbi:Signal sequence receptor subunit alpha [Aphelenchoides besseyi]|nr:Signal sequence receptor subunit alpha [Aphelenchoides besseyi]KAI6207864.1 Signal sequence receptor subunit alpha [Aphelenchoides besseyi]